MNLANHDDFTLRMMKHKYYLKVIFLGIGLISFNVFDDLARAEGAKRDLIQTLVTRKEDKLMVGGKEFRFLGLDAPNIQQNESQIREDRANRFPDEYEIRDIFGAIQREGGLATRTFPFSVFSPGDNGMPVYITGRRIYNEAAFQCLDRVIALAREYNVRLIIPFIASQSFASIRGVDEFSALSGKPKGSFLDG